MLEDNKRYLDHGKKQKEKTMVMIAADKSVTFVLSRPGTNVTVLYRSQVRHSVLIL